MRFPCWIPKATHTHTHTHTQYVILLHLHYNNGCTNAPQCHVIRILPVSLNVSLVVRKVTGKSPNISHLYLVFYVAFLILDIAHERKLTENIKLNQQASRFTQTYLPLRSSGM